MLFLSMLMAHLLLAFLWIVYCVLHSLLASVRVKEKMEKWFPKKFQYYRLGYVVFALVGLVAIVFYQLKMDTVPVFSNSGFLFYIGLVIAIGGALLMAVCIKKYFVGLSGLRSVFKKEEKPQLIVSGVHRYLRHPLYLGTFAAIWGVFFMMPLLSLAIANTIITGYTIYAIKWEEEKLVDLFGNDYKLYQAQVPKLFPRWKLN
ncbi:MAG: isoprenylcysteine carboxylmethyltransferase family protein [Bacteroidota bacterium]